MKSGFNNLNKIEKLDPVKNHLEIVQHTHQWYFSNETKISLQLAFPKTFAVHYIWNYYIELRSSKSVRSMGLSEQISASMKTDMKS